MKRAGWALLSVFLLSRCTMLQPETERAEVLFNPVITANQLEVSVMTFGCTQPGDFYLTVTDDRRIELRRTRLDDCNGTPELMRLSFDYPFGQQVFRFRNAVRFNNRVQP